MMAISPTIVWFRKDLRIEDHPALLAAQQKGGPIIPVYIWAPQEEGEWPLGAASKWWLHHSLEALENSLAEINLKLIIRKGDSLTVLMEIIQESKADTLFWHNRYEPVSIARDRVIKNKLIEKGLRVQSFNGSLLFEPVEISTKQNTPYKVFTPFWNCCLKTNDSFIPLKAPGLCRGFESSLFSEKINNLNLLPTIQWDKGLQSEWRPGEKNALENLKLTVETIVDGYATNRDRPDIDGVSKLSPHLHFGEVSPRQVWNAVTNRFPEECEQSNSFLRQLGWREFAHYLLYHFPHTPTQPLQERFIHFKWKENDKALKAWQRGLTGYPLVDAGMRQLWHIGWMHNRVRMIVGSFLVKDLMLPWQLGAKWFWDTLVDADLANNTLGWQWIAGCGADAAPYYRIFNPTTQGEKFDITRGYVRKWIPELASLPDKWLYKPWLAPKNELDQAGVVLGVDYPYPIVDHAIVRLEALELFQNLGIT